MVVINHQVEDDNNTTSIIAASKEDDLKREMIRLYEGKFEDDNNDGSRVSEADMELMFRVYKDTICPMICAEVVCLALNDALTGFRTLTGSTLDGSDCLFREQMSE
ncbi:hypothetical protein Hanom_Chr02g00109031 [Helianthus anomalus]